MQPNQNSALPPTRRGGVLDSKINKDLEYSAKKMATRWSKRNLSLATRLELGQARDALVNCGVVTEGPRTAASSLLSRILVILANPNHE